MAPAYLRYAPGPGTPAQSVVTIHNIAFQGRYDAAIFAELGLPPTAFTLDGVEYYGGVGFLKAGLQTADAITTVSPTYAAGNPPSRIRHGPRRPDRRPRATASTASSTASIRRCGTRRPTPRSPRRYTARTLAQRRANKRAIETQLRPRTRRRARSSPSSAG